MHFQKKFWKFYKPFFSNKTTNFDDKIILVEKGEVVSKNEEIATHFNNYFNDITKGLNIKKWCISDKSSDDPLVNAIRKYENHPSIINTLTANYEYSRSNSEHLSLPIET